MAQTANSASGSDSSPAKRIRKLGKCKKTRTNGCVPLETAGEPPTLSLFTSRGSNQEPLLPRQTRLLEFGLKSTEVTRPLNFFFETFLQTASQLVCPA